MKKLLLLFAIILFVFGAMLYLGIMPERFHDFVDARAPGSVSRAVDGIPRLRDSTAAPEPEPPVIHESLASAPDEVAPRDLPYITLRTIEGVLALNEEIIIPVVLPQGNDNEITQYFLSQVNLAVDVIRRDIPEVFWLSFRPYSIEWSGFMETREGTLTVSFIFRHTREEISRLIAQMQNAIYSLVSAAPDDPVEAVTFFHDWIINNTDYAQYLLDGNPIGNEHGFNIDGVFLRGSAVCEGYSKAFKLLLDKAGIPNVIVFGEAKDEKHSWNYVKLEGQWYLVDVTWNDPAGEENVLLHTFFLLGSESLVDGAPVSEIFSPDGADYPVLSRTGFFE